MQVDDSRCIISLDNPAMMDKAIDVELNDDFFQDQNADIIKGNVKASIKCSQISEGTFFLDIIAEGTVFTPCDRCLELVELRINIKKSIEVNLGDEDIEDDDMMTVDTNNPIVDLNLVVYQLVEVSLPIKRVHEPGMCDEAMMRLFNAHQVARSDDGESYDNESLDSPQKVDKRWEKLKSLKL